PLDQRLLSVRREPRPEGADDRLADVVLNGEDVACGSIIRLRPEVLPITRVNQLGADAQPVSRLSHASFEYTADVEPVRDLAGVDVSALEHECRGARRDPQTAHFRERADELLR